MEGFFMLVKLIYVYIQSRIYFVVGEGTLCRLINDAGLTWVHLLVLSMTTVCSFVTRNTMYLWFYNTF